MIFLKILFSIFILSFIVFVHELFHFIAAKILKIKTFDFSVGMGPRLISYKDKKIYFLSKGLDKNSESMEYNFRALPFGGFVSFGKLNENKEIIDELSKHKPWKRIIVSFAGPLGNIIFAVFLMVILLNSYGYKGEGVLINSVVENNLTKTLDLNAGDSILEINGKEVSSYDDLVNGLKLNKETICLKLNKDSKIVENCSDLNEQKELGFAISEKITFLNSIPLSVEKIYNITVTYITNFINLFIDFDIEKLNGPIGTVDTIQQNITSTERIITLMILVNIGLGIANLLLPLSMTDGGKIIIDIFCIILRKNNLNTNILDIISFILMLILFSTTSFFDIKSILNRF